MPIRCIIIYTLIWISNAMTTKQHPVQGDRVSLCGSRRCIELEKNRKDPCVTFEYEPRHLIYKTDNKEYS